MTSNGEEQCIVKNVSVGKELFREYRLSKSQLTERSPLWPAKPEVCQKIAEILKEKKSLISEYKRRIKQMEQSHTSWSQIAKTVNFDNEKFFLAVLSGSDKDIELFELENFLSNHGWTKTRNVEELTDEEKKELFACSADESAHDFCAVLEEKIAKSEHYEWICSKLVGSSGENCVAESDSDGTSSGSKKRLKAFNGYAKTEAVDNLVPNNQISDVTPVEKVSCDKLVIDELNVINGKEDSLQGVIPETDSQEIVDNTSCVASENGCDKQTELVEADKEAEKIAEAQASTEEGKTEDSKTLSPVAEELAEQKPPTNVATPSDVATPTNMATPTDVTLPLDGAVSPDKTTPIDVATTIAPSVSPTSQVEKPDDKVTTETVVSVTENFEFKKTQQSTSETVAKKENGNNSGRKESSSSKSSSKSSSSTKKQLADLSGYSRLRLTSSSSSTDAPPVQPPTPKVYSGNIWQQKAAEREEQQLAERKKMENEKKEVKRATPNPVNPPSSSTWANAARGQVQNGNQQNGQVKNTSKDSKKTVEANGWITFSNKKGGKPINGNLLKDHGKQESASSSTTASRKASTETSSVQLESPSLTIAEQNEQSSEPHVTGEIDGNSLDKPKIDEAEAEKRAKRRQRKQEKKKDSAKQKQEEEKKMKEQKRIEHEEKIEAEKKQKEEKKRLDFLEKQKELEETKRRLRQQNSKKPSKAIAPDPEELKKIADLKDRVNEHIQEKRLDYRLIGSKVYIDKRLTEFRKEEHKMSITKTKLKLLEKYRARISTLEEMSKFMVFVSFQLNDDDNKYKIEHLLEHIPHQSKSAAQKSPEYVAVNEKFARFCKHAECKASEYFDKAAFFVEEVLEKVRKMTDKTDVIMKTQQVLENYKLLSDEALDFINVTSFLLTRVQTDYFIIEEDFLLTLSDSENCGYQGENDRKNIDEQDNVNVHDMSCQTDEELYDNRAASFLVAE